MPADRRPGGSKPTPNSSVARPNSKTRGDESSTDVRAALLDLRAAGQQLEAAQTNVTLAGQELEQARDRFAAGVAGNLEVTQAQQSVAIATESYIDALYSHNLAKASLARAVGTAEQSVLAFAGGMK